MFRILFREKKTAVKFWTYAFVYLMCHPYLNVRKNNYEHGQTQSVGKHAKQN